MKKDIHNDYNDFLNGSAVAPSHDLSQKVLGQIQQELRFSPGAVLLKLGLVHVLTTALVLYICPQFGVSWGASSFSLMEAFMRFGHGVCAALCGVTLVGGTFLFAAMALNPQESFWLKQQMPWIPISLSLVTLILLAAAGAKGHHTEFVLWSAFAIVGGWAASEIGRKGRLYGFRFFAKLVA